MKKAAILSKPSREQAEPVARQVVEWLRAHGYEVVGDRETAEFVPGLASLERAEMAGASPDFVIVLGGDGTMLAAARAVSKAGVPIVGVNLGALGFLTEVPLDELMPTLEALHQNRCAVEPRAMVECRVLRGQTCVAAYDALNDVVVSKSAIARILDFDVYIDREFVSSYKADGLIVSTPTGSTAYSLAAGGPILAPDVDAFVMTPVSSHALTNRPLVVRDRAEIVIVVKNTQQEAYLSVDGQVGMPIQDGDKLVCRKSKHTIRLLRLQQRTFFDVLRTKLKWGQR